MRALLDIAFSRHHFLFARVLIASIGAICVAPSIAAEDLEPIVTEGEARAKDGKRAQDQIDKLSDKTSDLVAEYRQSVKVVDGLKVYNGLLQKQIDSQIEEVTQLEKSIDEVSLIERQVVPLMVRMIESLEQFVKLDTPFLSDERQKRVADLRAMMERSDVSAAEKFRRVLEAYQVENEYGRTIEAYKGSLELEGKPREVDFLRIGRVALLYQSLGGEHTGVWDGRKGDWLALSDGSAKQQISKGLRIARKQVAPDLLTLPVPAAEEVR